jgi:TetR/AcrR family transcriptional regulator, transcriptional repressor for nem operon
LIVSSLHMARTKNFEESAIVEKAIIIFRRQGYTMTTPAELVAYLGISRSSLYDTFGDKQTLFLRALQRYLQVTEKQREQILSQGKDVKEAIRLVFRQLIDECFEGKTPRGSFLFNTLVELTPDEATVAPLITASIQGIRQTFLTLIERGQSASQLPSTRRADALADYLMNCLSGISLSSRVGMDRKTCEAVMETSLVVLSTF